MSKKILVLAMGVLLAGVGAKAQHNLPTAQQPQHQHCGHCKHHMQVSNEPILKVNADGIALEITSVFPEVKTAKQKGNKTAVYNAQKELLGYVVYSKPASDGIKGYAEETPLMIALDKSGEKIITVVLLENRETPGYVKKVMSSNLLHTWDGMKIKKAKKKNVDAVSGATYTSRSIIESFKAAIKNL